MLSVWTVTHLFSCLLDSGTEMIIVSLDTLDERTDFLMSALDGNVKNVQLCTRSYIYRKKKLHFLSFLYLIPSRHSPGKSCYFAHWCRTGPNLCCCCIRCNNAHTHKCTQLKCIIKHRVHSVLKPQRGFGKLRLVIMLPNNPFDCKCLF